MRCCPGLPKELALLNNLSIFFTPLLLLYVLYRALRIELAQRRAQAPDRRRPQ